MSVMATNFEIVPNKSGKASVWAHFRFVKEGDVVDKKKIACTICNFVLKNSGNTTNLSDHLKRKHLTFTFRDKVKEKLGAHPETGMTRSATLPNLTLSATATVGGSLPAPYTVPSIFVAKLLSTSRRAKSLTAAVTQFIVKDLRPYSVVQNEGFKNLIHVSEPKNTIPSRQRFSEKVVPDLYHDIANQVKKNLQGNYVALTTNGWTSRATQFYITIISVHIDHDWSVRNYVLQTRTMAESHNGVNIAKVLNEATKEWGLPKAVPLVSDNAANMLVPAKEFGSELHVAVLLTHLTLKLNSVARLLGRMRHVVAFFHRSDPATRSLKQKQKLLQLPDHKHIIDVSTRWNSALDMVVRFLEQQPEIYAVLTSKEIRGKEKDIALLSDSEISLAEELVVVLTPLQTATNVLCDESTPTVSMILPLQHQLLSFMEQKEDDSEFIKSVKNVISNDLRERYKGIKTKLTLAALIDLRFKLAPFLNDEEKLDAFHNLTVEAVSVSNQLKVKQLKVKEEPKATEPLPLPSLSTEASVTSTVIPSISPDKKKAKSEKTSPPASPTEGNDDNCVKTAMLSLFGDVYITSVEEPKSNQEICETEVMEYRKEKSINANKNPLVWWKNHSDKYPNLAHLAKKYLCIPATSVPSERVFSTAGDIVMAQSIFVNNRFAIGIDNVQPCDWQFISPSNARQGDGRSCGIYVVQMAENYLNDQPLVFDWSRADVGHARVKIARQLLAEDADLVDASQRDTSDMDVAGTETEGVTKSHVALTSPVVSTNADSSPSPDVPQSPVASPSSVAPPSHVESSSPDVPPSSVVSTDADASPSHVVSTNADSSPSPDAPQSHVVSSSAVASPSPGAPPSCVVSTDAEASPSPVLSPDPDVPTSPVTAPRHLAPQSPVVLPSPAAPPSPVFRTT